MSNEDIHKKTVIDIVTEFTHDDELKEITEKQLYPLYLEIGKVNIEYMYNLLHNLVYDKRHMRVWLQVDDETMADYGMASNRLKLDLASCRSISLSDDLKYLICDISINGKGGSYPFPIHVLETAHVELDNKTMVNLRLLFKNVVDNQIAKLHASTDNDVSFGEDSVEETIETEEKDNVVKVNFGNRTLH